MLHLAITVICPLNRSITTIRINNRNAWIITLIITLIVPFLESSNHANLPVYPNPQTCHSNLRSTNNANNSGEAKDRTGPLGENIRTHRSHLIDFPLSKTTTLPVSRRQKRYTIYPIHTVTL